MSVIPPDALKLKLGNREHHGTSETADWCGRIEKCHVYHLLRLTVSRRRRARAVSGTERAKRSRVAPLRSAVLDAESAAWKPGSLVNGNPV